MNIRSINLELTKYFQRYTTAMNKLTGGGLVGFDQIRQIQDIEGVPVQYDQGRIVFKNGVDNLKYLLEHRDTVSEVIGVDSQDIYDNRRDLGKMQEYLYKMAAKYDLGKSTDDMQMYISRNGGNTGRLDSQADWYDYILTRTWIDRLARKTADMVSELDSGVSSDYRIEYLADLMQGMMKDHEGDYHRTGTFDESQFLNDGGNDRYNDALNRLRSMGVLEHGFYELFKPIGGTDEKYVKVKVSTKGEVDISGVVGLSDCEHVEWDYGSRDYLRSLNTGNQRYDFLLSLPFNDENSILYWKPDEPEKLAVDPENEGENEDATGYRYYKPYETERFLRWLGTTFVPMIDLDHITRKTLCSAPSLSTDVQGANFSDATNLTNMDLTRVNIDSSTSTSLLSLFPKATIDVINKLEPPGQYLMFIVGGNQQTSTLSFHVTGRMLNAITDVNHFANTLNLFRDSYRGLAKTILFFELSETVNGNMQKVWEKMFNGREFIPREWLEVRDVLKRLQTPTTIDLLRMREIDIETVVGAIMDQIQERLDFMRSVNGNEAISRIYVSGIVSEGEEVDRIMDMVQSSSYFNQNMYLYIQNYGNVSSKDQLAKWYNGIPIGKDSRENLVKKPLEEMYWENLTEGQKEQMGLNQYKVSYDGVTVDELRTSIETFNNLIVRLPPDPGNPDMMKDPYRFNVTSRHIFLDWKTFVDNSIEALIDKEDLHCMMTDDGPKKERGIGTDGREHEYVEYYTDRTNMYHTPLVDYSYIELTTTTNEDGSRTTKANHDRWDYWTEDDFK